jgi:hypothetical protein
MADANLSRSYIMSSGAVTVRQRPSLLLMKVPLSATEATLELGLAKLKKQCDAASRWLQRLDAVRVEFGEPHFADQADTGPLKQMRAATARALGQRSAKTASGESKRDVNMVLTATWDISSMSAEVTLVFVDRLRFEATDDADAAEPAEERQPWATPEERLHEMMAPILEPPAVDRTPQFLFIARLGEEQLEKASAEAFARARGNAERFARAVGMGLAGFGYLRVGVGDLESSRTNKLMQRQRCEALLAGCTYEAGENEIVSDDPRSAEFTVRVDVHYYLE